MRRVLFSESQTLVILLGKLWKEKEVYLQVLNPFLLAFIINRRNSIESVTLDALRARGQIHAFSFKEHSVLLVNSILWKFL